MKKATLIAIVVTLSTVMFAGVNVTWGNTYAENATTGKLGSDAHFGVWFDVNDATSVGWENGLKIGVAGPADTSLRLGYDSGTTLGVGWNYDLAGGGNGWGTTLGTAVDFTLTNWDEDDSGTVDADEIQQGNFSISVHLGFGF